MEKRIKRGLKLCKKITILTSFWSEIILARGKQISNSQKGELEGKL